MILHKTENITSALQQNHQYRGCSIYVKEQQIVQNCLFDNCSFREDLIISNLTNCDFSNCSFRNLTVKNLQSVNFEKGHIENCYLSKGKIKRSYLKIIIKNLMIFEKLNVFVIKEKILLVQVIGIIDTESAQILEDILGSFLQVGRRKLIFDLKETRYASTTGYGVFIKIVDLYNNCGGSCKFINTPRKIMTMFDMLGLLSFFELCETTEQVIKDSL